MKEKSKSSLLVTAGAGDGWEIPAEDAAKVNGRTRDVIQQLVDEHIGDPELRRMLSGPNAVFELSGQDEDGGFECPLSGDSDWQRDVVGGLEEGVKAIGVRRSHKGGF